MAYPKVVAFDLDGTIWSNWLDPNSIGRRGRVGRALEDNLEIIDNEIIADRRNPSQQVRVSPHIHLIMDDLISNGAIAVIVSKNPNEQLCNRAMWLLRTQIPRGSRERPFIDFISYNEIYSVPSKQTHFQAIRKWSGANYHEILFFDDQAVNNDVEMWQGITFHKVSDGRYGLTEADYRYGLYIWRRNQHIRCPMPRAGPNPHPNRKQVGWIGTDGATSELYRQGKRRPKSTRPSRWGWGCYVADDASIAAQFAKWGREHEPFNQYICQVFVRDFEVFEQMDKVWIPENGSVPQTHIELGDIRIAEDQIRRDDIISSTFGVDKPYILFSRHHWMDMLGTTWRRNHVRRFSEMVVYPQVQDALFYCEPYKLSDVQPLINRGDLKGFDFRHKFEEWNIHWNRETERDFETNRERFS